MTGTEPLRVMLIDDDVAFRTALADSFEIAGLDIETYGDGQSALANLSADFPGSSSQISGCHALMVMP